MKKIISMLLISAMSVSMFLTVHAEGNAPAVIEITDAVTNDLYSIVEEYTPEQSNFKNYQSHLKTINPETPALAGFMDGWKETEDSYVNARGEAITLPKFEGWDENYFKETAENELVFAGNKYNNTGFIQLTDKDRDSAYTVLYEYTGNVLYKLPEGYEMTRLNHYGEAYLYKVSEDKTVEKAYKTILKVFPTPTLLFTKKVQSDVNPIITEEGIYVPLRVLCEIYKAEVTWDETTRSVTLVKKNLNPEEYKWDDMTITLTIGSTKAIKDGEEITLTKAPMIIDGRTLVSTDFLEEYFKLVLDYVEETKKVNFAKKEEYWRQVGYEDAGYESPALSSNDPYPEYIKAEVDETVETVKALQNENTLNLTFITDLHYAINDNHSVRMQRTTNSYREIANAVDIEKLLLGGDYTNEGRKDYKIDSYVQFKKFFEGLDYLPVNGNHDDGSIWDNGYINNPTAINHLNHSELYELMYNHLPALGAKFNENAEENSTLYYYVDDEETKMRYICLDSGDVPYMFTEDGKLKYKAQHEFAMSQKQVDWLINDALKIDEEGWGIVVTTHYVPYPKAEKGKEKANRYMSVLTDILDAYKNGTKISADYFEGDYKEHVEADFSGYAKNDVIAVLAGDRHTDRIEYSESGIPHIFTGNSVTYYNQAARKDGDKRELLYDVLTIDRVARKIYVTRVGAGENREATY